MGKKKQKPLKLRTTETAVRKPQVSEPWPGYKSPKPRYMLAALKSGGRTNWG